MSERGKRRKMSDNSHFFHTQDSFFQILYQCCITNRTAAPSDCSRGRQNTHLRLISSSLATGGLIRLNKLMGRRMAHVLQPPQLLLP